MKICVYAICKNEEKFVSSWLESMQEADYICVLDTGSRDKTVELLRAHPKVILQQKEIQIQTYWIVYVCCNLFLEKKPRLQIIHQ